MRIKQEKINLEPHSIVGYAFLPLYQKKTFLI